MEDEAKPELLFVAQVANRCQNQTSSDKHSRLRAVQNAVRHFLDFRKSLLQNDLQSGGGGDRTRVPQCIHEGFYVCSRLFGVSPREAPVDRVSARLDQNVFNPWRAGRDQERFGIGNWRPGVSDEPP